MDKIQMNEQIKKIDEEIGRAIEAISELENIVKSTYVADAQAIASDTNLSIKEKFGMLTKKLDEVTRAIVSTGIISDTDIDDEIQSRH